MLEERDKENLSWSRVLDKHQNGKQHPRHELFLVQVLFGMCLRVITRKLFICMYIKGGLNACVDSLRERILNVHSLVPFSDLYV